MAKADDEIQFGIYACSPEELFFKVTFTNFEVTDSKWLAVKLQMRIRLH
ncbi:DUF1349 domain-containing protein [Ligilactobacillus salivarius]|nr:DUF1349 domain-containing protein [Ligilactobacillus salivarius]MCO7135247.1 DUF1349 domain-containing protein [Ligilactobacillus salivarius]